jgi:hypothetical protein
MSENQMVPLENQWLMISPHELTGDQSIYVLQWSNRHIVSVDGEYLPKAGRFAGLERTTRECHNASSRGRL